MSRLRQHWPAGKGKGKEKERKGKERSGKERKGKEMKGTERKGKERTGQERKGKERKQRKEWTVQALAFFARCYHCNSNWKSHVRSGALRTARIVLGSAVRDWRFQKVAQLVMALTAKAI